MPTPEFKTEAERALDDIQSVADRMQAQAHAHAGCVSRPMAWIIAILCTFCGFIAGKVT